MDFCPVNRRLQPGFRFHPTNEELVMYYLKRKVLGKSLKPEVITEVDVYQFHPKDLREFSNLKKDLNWYFFCPRGRKYGSGERTNRATHSGYWKATGVDRVVSYKKRPVGKIKTLVFHEGKPPKGNRTDWVMHEYKLEDKNLADEVFQGSYVLCKIYEKSGWGPKNSEQYGAPFAEEEWEDDDEILNAPQVLHIENHKPSTSALTDSCLSNVLVNASTEEQVYFGAVDQAPYQMLNAPDAAVTVAAVTVAAVTDAAVTDAAVTDAAVTVASVTVASVTVASSSKHPYCDYAAAADQMFNNDDEIDRMLERFVADDYADVFGSLGNLDHWSNTEEVGFNFSDLDAPL